MTLPSRSTFDPHSGHRTLVFVRHGATQPNLDGLRCGGDLDLPLTGLGREQVAAAAQRIAAAGWPIDLIVASDLERTRESARIVSDALGGVEIAIDPGWRERALGRWNLCPVADHEAALRAGQQPPGGESAAAFADRIEQALQRLLMRSSTLPLLIGSKGVARVLGERLLDARGAAPVANGQLLCFPLPRPAARAARGRPQPAALAP
jgi:probable phosphoglycerate mutase